MLGAAPADAIQTLRLCVGCRVGDDFSVEALRRSGKYLEIAAWRDDSSGTHGTLHPDRLKLGFVRPRKLHVLHAMMLAIASATRRYIRLQSFCI